MITERTLRQWRRDALLELKSAVAPVLCKDNPEEVRVTAAWYEGMFKSTTMRDERILRLTQELLDQHLMKK